MSTKSMIVVHHTGMPGSNLATVTHQHVVVNGWAKVGYHVVIEKSGEAFRTRADAEVGCHTVGANTGSLAVCLCGDFNLQEPRPAQWDRLVDVVSTWCAQHDIMPSETTIVGHKDLQPVKLIAGQSHPNTCPGSLLHVRLPELRSMVAARFWQSPADEFQLSP